MQIVESNNFFNIYFPYRPHLLAAVKALPQRRFNMEQKHWFVPIQERTAVERFAKKYNFKFAKPSANEIEPDFTIPLLPELTIDIPLKREMFPYQKMGVAYNLEHKRVIVGDKPGLGKTVQSIATFVASGAKRCLVICPSSLKINWKREVEMWSDKRAAIIDKTLVRYYKNYDDAGLGFDIWIVNYESLKKYFVKDMPKKKGIRLNDVVFNGLKDLFDFVIIDEAHRCKSFQTLQTKLTKGIASGKEWIFALTGTPVVNKPIDLVSQLGIIDQYKPFGGYKGFIDRYCAGEKQASNLKELNYKLSLNCFYQRAKEDVLKDLPAKMRQIVYCTIDTRQEYAEAEANLEDYLRKYTAATEDDILRALRGEIMVRIGKLKNISARGKMKDVCSFIDDVMESGEKLVVFAHLKEIFHVLKSHYPRAVSITGVDNNLQRDAAVQAFQNDSECKLILCSIKAAGVGITLTASSRVAFIELPWHAADTEQCEDRCHRIGQKESVQCTYFLGQDTYDEKIYQIIESKRGIASEVTGNEDATEVSIVDNIVSLFNQNRKTLL